MVGKKKEIFIILSFTGTILSRIIKLYTKDEYCHVSIALDKELNDIYSFGRINAYNPFVAGFIKEGLDIGTFKRFKKTKAAIYSVPVSGYQYYRIKKKINQFKKEKNKYGFNFLGVIGVAFHIPIKRKNYYYCSEFVKYIIEDAKIDMSIPHLPKPIDFKGKELNLIYKGLLKKYPYTKKYLQN